MHHGAALGIQGGAELFLRFLHTLSGRGGCCAQPSTHQAGVTWLCMTGDDFSEKAGRIRIETENPNRNVEMTTLGVRGALPFSVGSAAMSLKGDLSWMHFFGDTSPQARLGLGGSGAAVLSGGKLDNMIGVGVGLEAALA